jgi:hypothetical protein
LFHFSMAAYLRQSSLFLRTPTEGGGCEPSNSCIRKDFLGVRKEKRMDRWGDDSIRFRFSNRAHDFTKHF